MKLIKTKVARRASNGEIIIAIPTEHIRNLGWENIRVVYVESDTVAKTITIREVKNDVERKH